MLKNVQWSNPSVHTYTLTDFEAVPIKCVSAVQLSNRKGHEGSLADILSPHFCRLCWRELATVHSVAKFNMGLPGDVRN